MDDILITSLVTRELIDGDVINDTILLSAEVEGLNVTEMLWCAGSLVFCETLPLTEVCTVLKLGVAVEDETISTTSIAEQSLPLQGLTSEDIRVTDLVGFTKLEIFGN